MTDVVDNDEILQRILDAIELNSKLLRVLIAQNEELWGAEVNEEDMQ